MSKTIKIGLTIVVFFAALFLLVSYLGEEELINDINNNDVNNVQIVLNDIPHQVEIGTRTIVFDEESVPESPWSEYSQREIAYEVEEGEGPISYIERHLERSLSFEHVQDQPDFFDYSVSFYRLSSNRLSVFVRLMNIPDDSVGGGEERFDFVFSGGEWFVDSYGERVYCRRPDQQFWQPADELCP